MGLSTVKMAIGNELVLADDPTEEEEEPEEVAEEEEEEEDEEELVDPQDTAKETCGSKSECSGYKSKYEACNDRLSGGDSEETCEEELFDFLRCVDHCVSKALFNQLK